MNEPSHPDLTVDANADVALDAGLAAAFEPDSGPALPGGASVLKALGASLPAVPRINLREPDNEPATPVVRPRSPAMPGAPDPSGRYQMVGEIARGGMGAVLKGRDVDLGRDIAVKVLLETHAGRTEFLQRFVEEAQISGQLQHPGIVPVYELGQFADKRPYFTMKLVKGQTLAKLLAERRKSHSEGQTDASAVDEAARFVAPVAKRAASPTQHADVARFLKIFEQVCQTLAYAHARGVIHRDVKPANIMVGTFGEVQVMDWGLAKVLAEGGIADEAKASREHQSPEPEPTMIRTARSDGSDKVGSVGSFTLAGSVLGTPAYMAPEQARGDVDLIDERADVFGLGALLCEILTGQPPFTGKQAEAMRKAQTGDVTDALSRLAQSEGDGDLIGLAQRCLAAEPWHRPRDAGVVAKDVTAYLESVQARLHQAELAHAEEVIRAEAAQATAAEERKAREAAQAKMIAERRARRMTLALAASVLAMVVVGGGGWMWLKAEQNARALEAAQLAEKQQRDVDMAVEEASRLRDQALKLDPVEGQAALSAALAAWKRAERLAADVPVLQATKQRLDELGNALAMEERDRRMLARLEEVRLIEGEPNPEAGGDTRQALAIKLYHEAFRDYGVDLDKGDLKASGDWIAARAPRAPLVAILDNMAFITQDKEERVRLRAIADVADADPAALTQQMRQALIRNDMAALRKLAKEADVDKLSPTTLADLGAVLMRRAPEDSIALLLRAQTRHADNFWINRIFGMVLAQEKRHDEALRYYHASLSVRPRNARTWVDIGYQLFYRKKPGDATPREQAVADALAAFQKAVDLRPDYDAAHRALGWCYGQQSDWPKAMVHLRKSIELNPDDTWTWQYLAGAHRQNNELDEALAVGQKGLERHPKAADIHWIVGQVLNDRDDWDKAQQHFKEAVRLESTRAGRWEMMALAYEKRKVRDKAIQAYEQAIRLGSKTPASFTSLTKLHRDNKDWEKAVAVCKDLIGLEPKSLHYIRLGDCYLMASSWDLAIAAYHEAIRIGPPTAATYGALGYALNKKKDYDAASAASRAAVALDPTRWSDWQMLAESLVAKNHPAEALAAYQEAARLDAKNPARWANVARLHNRLKEWNEAAAAADTALALSADHPSALFERGFALTGKGDHAGAAAAYRDVLRVSPKNGAAYNNLAFILREQGDIAEARNVARAGKDLGTGKTAAFEALLRDLERLTRLDEQLARLSAGELKIGPAAEKIELAYFCQHPSKRHFVTAAQLYEEAFKLSPLLVDLFSQHRYNAACAAALAGNGQGKDADKLDEPARAAWRNKALQWLKADLADYAKHLEVNLGAANANVRLRLQHWQRDADLSGLRDADALAKLPAAEQTACRALWDEVAGLLKKTAGGEAVPSGASAAR